MNNKKALAIDCNSLFYRCFYGTIKTVDYYKKYNLIPTNAIKLFIKSLNKILNATKYNYCLIAFDYGKKTFRTEKLDQYKANRPSMPDDLAIQLPYLKSILDALGYKNISLQGYEADDLIGSFCKKMNENDIFVDVFSSDKDLLQLVNEKTNVNLFMVGISEIKTFTLQNFAQLFHNLQPQQIIDYKAIVGDNSDNFKGIKGIGPKTAINLLIKYKSFSNIYDHIEELSPKQKELFIRNKQDGVLCYELSTIIKNLFDNSEIDNFKFSNINLDELKKILTHLKISNL